MEIINEDRQNQQKEVVKNLIRTAEENIRITSDELAMYKNRVEVLKQVLDELGGDKEW